MSTMVLRASSLGIPIVLLLLMALMTLRVPAFLLDVSFTFNIALAIVVLLVCVYALRPLEFAAFPTILLLATLLRLALNVASTRVVLLDGHTGGDAAGKVIQSFGEVVVGGNYVVGLVVFVILVIINFVVVTKGAGRISEVSARFTLDAMPGKQMAIDADLNAGIIDQDKARDRREEIAQEADFYGSMDGASKFVRGDAVAGILILVINILGGLVIGMSQHGLAFSDAIRVYTLLTIGDGLVAQIPSLLLSTAAAIMVTRVSGEADVGQQVVQQLFRDGRALGVAGGVLCVLGLIPGMPHFVFLSLAGLAGIGAWKIARRNERADGVPDDPGERDATDEAPVEVGWDDVAPVDMLGLEVGYRLIPLVDKQQGGELLSRIKGVRKKLSQELGFLVPSVHIRDNLELLPNTYRLSLMGVTVAEAEIFPDKFLAIDPGEVFGRVEGIAGKDPAFGLDATWIDEGDRDNAQTLGYTVVDPSTVIATHLSELLKGHAHQLLGHEEVQQLLDRLAQTAPKLVENLTPGSLPLGVVVKVMQDLLAEKVPIRNVRTIAETLAEHAARSQDPAALLAATREALGGSIVQSVYGLRDELPVITLDPALEQLLKDSVQAAQDGAPSFEPGLADKLHGALVEAAQRQEMSGDPAVLLVAAPLRPWLARLTRYSIANLQVLAYGEIPQDKRLRVVTSVGGG